MVFYILLQKKLDTPYNNQADLTWKMNTNLHIQGYFYHFMKARLILLEI